jgi:hypothetical protein
MLRFRGTETVLLGLKLMTGFGVLTLVAVISSKQTDFIFNEGTIREWLVGTDVEENSCGII